MERRNKDKSLHENGKNEEEEEEEDSHPSSSCSSTPTTTTTTIVPSSSSLLPPIKDSEEIQKCIEFLKATPLSKYDRKETRQLICKRIHIALDKIVMMMKNESMNDHHDENSGNVRSKSSSGRSNNNSKQKLYNEWIMRNIVKEQQQKKQQHISIQQQQYKKEREQAMEDAIIHGNPRDYQILLFEVAKKSNTIIHLGTGKGKTLIAILLIQHFFSLQSSNEEETVDDENENETESDEQTTTTTTTESNKTDNNKKKKKKQTLFIVPSVPLALQQTTTLKANLPYKVVTACNNQSSGNSNNHSSRSSLTKQTQQNQRSSSSRHDVLLDADIIVATHGAIYDLFNHYGCGKHHYKIIMEKFYHTLPPNEDCRPHVLGLTASPLSNIKPTHSDEHLAKKLYELEQTLDSKVVSLQRLMDDNKNDSSSSRRQQEGMTRNGNDDDDYDKEIVDINNQKQQSSSSSSLIHKPAEERFVMYASIKDLPDDYPYEEGNLNDIQQLHPGRTKEFRRLQSVYLELGPLPLALYCRTLLNEVTRNTFEQETTKEYNQVLCLLQQMEEYCMKQTTTSSSCCGRTSSSPFFGGRSHKLIQLECLLEERIEFEKYASTEPVGLIFVEQRITAIVLKLFFKYRQKQIDAGTWIYAKSILSSSDVVIISQQMPPTSPANTSSSSGSHHHDNNDMISSSSSSSPSSPTPKLVSTSLENASQRHAKTPSPTIEGQFDDASSCDMEVDEDDEEDDPSAFLPIMTKGTFHYSDRLGTMSSSFSSNSRPTNILQPTFVDDQFADASSSDVDDDDDENDDNIPSEETTTTTTAADKQTTEEQQLESPFQTKAAKESSLVEGTTTTTTDTTHPNVTILDSTTSGQFCDADDDDDDQFNEEVLQALSRTREGVEEPVNTIRVGVLIRHATKIFKYLRPAACRKKKIVKTILKQEEEEEQATTMTTTTTTEQASSSMSTTTTTTDNNQTGGSTEGSSESDNDEEEEEESANHQIRIRATLNALRKREINLLIATSMVEEGVDIQACSFVVVFHRLRNTKAYVQMKGRARQQEAKFFVFQDQHHYISRSKRSLFLDTAQDAEKRVIEFLATRGVTNTTAASIDDESTTGQVSATTTTSSSSSLFLLDTTRDKKNEKSTNDDNCEEEDDNNTPLLPSQLTGEDRDDEIQAIVDGEYRTKHSQIDLRSAKSLLNRYALHQPMSSAARTTREAFMIHMPTFEEYQLILPAHLPIDIRIVTLPAEFRDKPRNERHQMLALMACVRLHSKGLLNDRLLPQTKNDLTARMLQVATSKSPSQISKVSVQMSQYFASSSAKKEVYVYRIHQEGEGFQSALHTCQGGRYNDHIEGAAATGQCRLALVSSVKLDVMMNNTPTTTGRYYHHAFGSITLSLDEKESMIVEMTMEDWILCCNFSAAVYTSRWRRKTQKEYFQPRPMSDEQDLFSPYVLGFLRRDGEVGGGGLLDMEYMNQIYQDFSRSHEDRWELCQDYDTQPGNTSGMPRLCNPTYDPNVSYVVLGPTKLDCRATFIRELEGGDGSIDYFRQHWDTEVSPDSKLFLAQRMWTLPGSAVPKKEETNEGTSSSTVMENTKGCPDDMDYCGMQVLSEQLRTVLLPQELLREAIVPDPALALMSVVLPQFLYQVDRLLIAQSLVGHCKSNLPSLGTCLDQVPIHDVLEAITGKSTGPTHDMYDRLEWLGDGVLKMIQTDALLHTPELAYWVGLLHEGDLSTLRAAMGKNDFLCDACKRTGLDRFIQTTPFARGLWVPCNMELHTPSVADVQTTTTTKLLPYEGISPSSKVCADVVESLLGLVYVQFGYKVARKVALEMGVSLPTPDKFTVAESVKNNGVVPRPRLEALVKKLTGRGHFSHPELIEEALTHPSALYQQAKSYQLLEWCGDAVLCVATRDWIYREFHDSMDVGGMVALEGALVSNELLAYRCVQTGLHRFIAHRDQSLPSHLEDYEWTIKDMGRGLWGTGPSKILGDVVEAVIAISHMDAGFEAGQQAVRTLMAPILHAVVSFGADDALRYVRHPKTTLNEMGGCFFQVMETTEDHFTRSTVNSNKMKIWTEGRRWREIGSTEVGGGGGGSNQNIATVNSMGIQLLSLSESSRLVARNRICALVVDALNSNPELNNRVFQVMRIISGAKKFRRFGEIANDEEEEDDGDEEI